MDEQPSMCCSHVTLISLNTGKHERLVQRWFSCGMKSRFCYDNILKSLREILYYCMKSFLIYLNDI